MPQDLVLLSCSVYIHSLFVGFRDCDQEPLCLWSGLLWPLPQLVLGLIDLFRLIDSQAPNDCCPVSNDQQYVLPLQAALVFMPYLWQYRTQS